MKIQLALMVLLASSLASCVSNDGTYSPGCIAYAGNKITLDDGQFVWEKFTDEVVVNEAGEVVDQFPGYPLRGKYSIDGQSVQMTSAAGETLQTMYLHSHEGRRYLLSNEENSTWQATGSYANCALQLVLEN